MKQLLNKVDRDSLVETASDLVNIASPTGHEQPAAEYVARALGAMGLQVSWQEVEEGRPNVLARLEGSGGGKTLMFNGHLDTSYSGREPWLRGSVCRSKLSRSGRFVSVASCCAVSLP